MMKRFVSILVFAITLSASACAEPFRIATYNVNWGNRRGDQILDAIRESNADVICFQETTQNSERFLRQRLASSHPYFHSTGHHGGSRGERFAYASKTKLKALKYVPPTAGLFGFYTARTSHSGVTIHIANIHLTPFQIPTGAGLRDAMQAISATEDKHLSEVEGIIARLDRRRPTVVVGDLNSISSFQAPKRLITYGMIDAFDSIYDSPDAKTTWSWPTRPLPLALRIDYIFHSTHFKTLSARVIRRKGSDHSLIVATLELSSTADADRTGCGTNGNSPSLIP